MTTPRYWSIEEPATSMMELSMKPMANHGSPGMKPARNRSLLLIDPTSSSLHFSPSVSVEEVVDAAWLMRDVCRETVSSLVLNQVCRMSF